MIDLTLQKNPAREGALLHARKRADRERASMFVYVASPGVSQWEGAQRFNRWFVRSSEEGTPDGGILFATIIPKALQ